MTIPTMFGTVSTVWKKHAPRTILVSLRAMSVTLNAKGFTHGMNMKFSTYSMWYAAPERMVTPRATGHCIACDHGGTSELLSKYMGMLARKHQAAIRN
eukprot:CAMPEP_0172751648 /NCGR_PEP_ID=MMETSP1074-20121228/152202_1 /TAXON_ID=2916 /ORGANISM="Ceratium fusus, Strain PA161109" /LENGTH=97 /DNA_ID=CAMNT_0013584039 /DNA_START=152 /DNA_END=445 /DNA_ORIENTATION=+